MIIRDEDWTEYIETLRKVNDAAADDMGDFLDLNRDDDGYWNSKGTRMAILRHAYGLVTKYGSAAAELAAEMYDAVAKRSGKNLPDAEPAETATFPEVAKAVNGTIKYSEREDVIAGTVGRLTRMAAADTVLQNGSRDGAEWAWIPQGNETCAFCIMLASRGWQHASKAVLNGGHAEHIHPNCDCMYAIRFDSDTQYGSYDPSKYKKIYDDAEGSDWHEKLNFIRWEQENE